MIDMSHSPCHAFQVGEYQGNRQLTLGRLGYASTPHPHIYAVPIAATVGHLDQHYGSFGKPVIGAGVALLVLSGEEPLSGLCNDPDCDSAFLVASGGSIVCGELLCRGVNCFIAWCSFRVCLSACLLALQLLLVLMSGLMAEFVVLQECGGTVVT